LRALMQKRGRLMATTLRTRPPEEKSMLLQAFARRILPFLADGTMVPLVDRAFPLDDAADALDAVREPGKLASCCSRCRDDTASGGHRGWRLDRPGARAGDRCRGRRRARC